MSKQKFSLDKIIETSTEICQYNQFKLKTSGEPKHRIDVQVQIDFWDSALEYFKQLKELKK